MVLDSKNAALIVKSPYFSANCPDHGLTNFFTATEQCAACFGNLLKGNAAASAINSGHEFYGDECAVHGPANFYARGRRCSLCYTKTGKERRNTARATARRRGLSQYLDNCEIHGAANFSVRWGMCLQCTTTEGAQRTKASRVSFPVEKDILPPLPRQIAKYSWPFATMGTGHSVAVPPELLERAKGAMNQARKKGRAFRRATQPDGTIRIWRIG